MKFLLIFILLTLGLHARDNYELKLYEKVLPLILGTRIIYAYTDSDAKEIIKTSSIFHIISSCEDIDIIISRKISKNVKCKNIPFFATSYSSYINSSNAIGAFYWRKGRPQLILNADIIKKFDLNMPKDLRKYAK